MIIQFGELKRHRQAVAMVDGAFDPLHLGHIEYFQTAHALGLPLFCCVASDRYVSLKHKPLLTEDYRAGIIDAIRYISYTYINRGTTAEVLAELQPAMYVKGRDWEGRLPAEQVEVCGRYGIRIIFLDTVRDSSTRIIRRYLS